MHCANLQHSTTKRIVQLGQNSKQNQQRLDSFEHFKHVCFMRRAKNVDPPLTSINNPEPSTLIVKLFHRHQCACEYKSFIICEKAKMWSISISTEVNMQGNQRTKSTEVRGSRSVEHCWISPTYRKNTLCQSTTFYNTSTILNSAKCHAKIRTDFTRLKIIAEYSFSKLLVVKHSLRKSEQVCWSQIFKKKTSKAGNQCTKVCWL